MDARARYDELADDLAAQNADIQLGQMMGMPAIKAAGKMIGGFYTPAEAAIFKLPDPEVRERALALDGAQLFDPMGGRPMKEWVQVPVAHADLWPSLAADALRLRASG